MRIKNKEIRQRRQRKEQKIKEVNRELLAKYGDKKTAPKPSSKPAAKRAPRAKKESE